MNRPLKPALPEKPAEPLHNEPAPAEDRAHALLADLERVTSVVKHELARSAPAGSSASEATQQASEQADVESLESYLDRFMERMTGKKPATAALAETQPIPRTPQVTEIIPPPPPREPAAAPERREQLTALRQVANQNARNAVILHDCQGLMVQTRALLAGACGASCLSSGLAILALVGNSSWARLSAVVTCVLAVVLSCWFFGLYRRLRGRAGQLQTDE
jgi:hypothetical protein